VFAFFLQQHNLNLSLCCIVHGDLMSRSLVRNYANNRSVLLVERHCCCCCCWWCIEGKSLRWEGGGSVFGPA